MRFVFQLAVVLGIDDPIQWMDSKPPEVIDRWILYCRDNPLPDSWEQMATLAAEVYAQTQWIAISKQTKLPNRSISEWMPETKQAETSTQALSAVDSEKWIRAQIGV